VLNNFEKSSACSVVHEGDLGVGGFHDVLKSFFNLFLGFFLVGHF